MVTGSMRQLQGCQRSTYQYNNNMTSMELQEVPDMPQAHLQWGQGGRSRGRRSLRHTGRTRTSSGRAQSTGSGRRARQAGRMWGQSLPQYDIHICTGRGAVTHSALCMREMGSGYRHPVGQAVLNRYLVSRLLSREPVANHRYGMHAEMRSPVDRIAGLTPALWAEQQLWCQRAVGRSVAILILRA